MTKETEATVMSALALAAQQYADPSGIYDAIREIRPDVDWADWIASVERRRAGVATRESVEGAGVAVDGAHAGRATRPGVATKREP